jgi:tetratricopeptide (TPR) repeat protein
MVRMFAVMDRKLEPEPIPIGWLDHRKIKDRIVRLSRAIGLKGDAVAVGDAAYVGRMRPVLLQNIELDLGSRRFRSAIVAAQRLVAAHPGDATACYWLGEGYRSLGPRKESLDKSDLTSSGRAKGYSRMVRQTEDEEAAKLLQSPEGRAALESSERKAEDAYRRSAEIDPKLPNPQLGLGMIYERQGKREAAISAYLRYIELEPGDASRERARRRILAIESKGTSK